MIQLQLWKAEFRDWRPAIWHSCRRWQDLANVARHRRLWGEQWDETYTLAVVADIAQAGRFNTLASLAIRGLIHAGGVHGHSAEYFDSLAKHAYQRGSWVEALRLGEHAGAIDAIGPHVKSVSDIAIGEAGAGQFMTTYRPFGLGERVSRDIVSHTIVAHVERSQWLKRLSPRLADYLLPFSLIALNETLMDRRVSGRNAYGLDLGPFLARWWRRGMRSWRTVLEHETQLGLSLILAVAEGDIVFRVADEAETIEGDLVGPRDWKPENHLLNAETIAGSLYAFHRHARLYDVNMWRAPSSVLQQGGLLVEKALSRLSANHSSGTLTVAGTGVLAALPWAGLFVNGQHLVELFDIVVDDGLPNPPPSLRPPCAAALWGTNETMKSEAAMVIAAARALGFPTGDARPLTRESLAAAMQEATVIHIASHYVAHPHEPGSGRLQLADGEWISIKGITGLAAGVQLLFLAGCESGAPTDAGDGWVLDGTHPWRSAGVESVVASLWRISDVHTPSLVSSFYGQLFAGATRAAALSNAQRDLIAQNDKLTLSERFIEPTSDPMPAMVVSGAHPRIWSGFRLTGNGGPIQH